MCGDGDLGTLRLRPRCLTRPPYRIACAGSLLVPLSFSLHDVFFFWRLYPPHLDAPLCPVPAPLPMAVSGPDWTLLEEGQPKYSDFEFFKYQVRRCHSFHCHHVSLTCHCLVLPILCELDLYRLCHHHPQSELVRGRRPRRLCLPHEPDSHVYLRLQFDVEQNVFTFFSS